MEPDVLISWDSRIIGYSSVSSIAFLVWDIFITLNDEVNLVWAKPNTFKGKWLFLFIRYFAVAFQLSSMFLGKPGVIELQYSPRACMIWYIYQGFAEQVLVACVEIVLIIRVQAIYHHNMRVSRILYALLVLENACMAISLVLSIRGTTFDSTCFVIRTSQSLIYYVVAFGAFETLLFVLTLAKTARMLCSHWRDTPLIFILVRDGTWAFALIFAALCISLGFYLGASAVTAITACQWLLTIEAFAGARLMLNMLALESQPDGDSDGRDPSTMIQFAEPASQQQEDQLESIDA